jgi:hypothetical protein
MTGRRFRLMRRPMSKSTYQCGLQSPAAGWRSAVAPGPETVAEPAALRREVLAARSGCARPVRAQAAREVGRSAPGERRPPEEQCRPSRPTFGWPDSGKTGQHEQGTACRTQRLAIRAPSTLLLSASAAQFRCLDVVDCGTHVYDERQRSFATRCASRPPPLSPSTTIHRTTRHPRRPTWR